MLYKLRLIVLTSHDCSSVMNKSLAGKYDDEAMVCGDAIPQWSEPTSSIREGLARQDQTIVYILCKRQAWQDEVHKFIMRPEPFLQVLDWSGRFHCCFCRSRIDKTPPSLQVLGTVIPVPQPAMVVDALSRSFSFAPMGNHSTHTPHLGGSDKRLAYAYLHRFHGFHKRPVSDYHHPAAEIGC